MNIKWKKVNLFTRLNLFNFTENKYREGKVKRFFIKILKKF